MVGTDINSLFTLWLPLVAALLLALFGFLRGALREAIVSGAIILAALINFVWAGLWSEDVRGFISGSERGTTQFWLSSVLMVLIVLVVGYILGGTLPKHPLTGTERVGGGLLGFFNGAAIAGWIIRYAFVDLDGAQATSRFYTGNFAQGFMIWAGWFPVFLAVVGTVVAILRPLRRAQTAVAQPAAATDWRPATAPAAAYVPGQATANSTQAYSPPLQQPVGTTPPPPPQFTGPYRGPSPTAIEYQATPNRNTPGQGGYVGPASTGSQTPHAPAVARADPAIDRSSQPTLANEQVGAASAGTQVPDFADTSEPSWLVGEPPTTRMTPDETSETRSFTVQDSPSTETTSFATLPANGGGSTEVNCPQCGASVDGDATFCTECGMRLKG